MRAAVVVFPGSNCDRDALRAAELAGFDVRFVWHKESAVDGFDLIVLPGGFSFGDYLRTGAIARWSPIMSDVVRQAERGVMVLGICNGFQILTEAGLLPGVLLRNKGLLFLSEDVALRVENASTAFTSAYKRGQTIRLPIAHGDGNYYVDAEGLKRLEGEGRVVFRYADEPPNGALNGIAGIINERGNVLGMMPHPERHCEDILGSHDGKGVFESLMKDGVPK
ncbi:MAG: phosphoribosylformylglycinamidine synthase subunit PurQ [Synergistaceae bacterium]|jgi:phosphoribosylformylglycinamidine synthase|nr:phosphoribosylformylglycinamidine synthase subunit PurQ [Synergistaceae bacterium]